MINTEGKLKIYRSSAGSGKTFTLVTEYLKLVLADPSSYRKILAITFTNKATEEMKSRIIAQLVKIAAGTESNYIKEQLPFLSPEEAEAKARKALSNILHDYSGFAISTIDSFFSSMVRNLARELNLPMRFEMELGQDHVIRQITFDLFEDIETDAELREWLREYLMDMLDRDKGWKIEPRIHDTARQLFTDTFRQTHENGNAIPGKELIAKLKQIRNAMMTQLKSFGQQLESVMRQHGLAVEDFAHGKSGPAAFAAKLQQSSSTIPEFGTRFLKAAEDPTGWYTKSKPKADIVRSLAESTLVGWAKEVIDYTEKHGPSFFGASETLKLIYLTGLLGRLQKHLVSYREETDTILLSDVNYMLRKAIGPSDAPFIYEKAGNRFRHFMLDEFQDTSSTQWDNMLPLLINSLSTANSSLIVGDAKQSIYRWRGGRMELLQHGVEKDLSAFKGMIAPLVLNQNWRSRETVVTFNNTFFPLAATLLAGKLNTETSKLLSDVYTESNVHQQFRKGKEGDGYVKISFYDKKDNGDDSGEEDEAITKQSWKFRSMEDTCDKIKELEERGYPLGEMVILCRTNEDALFITSHLLNRGITKLISPESLLLEGSADIRFLISLLRYIENRNDHISLAHICHYHDNRKTSLHELFSAPAAAKTATLPEAFLSRINEFRTITLYETTEELCRIFGLIEKADAYIQRFHDLIQEYVNSNPSGISDFLEWWDENRQTDKCSVILPPGKDSIRIMSIHKSKGLEFKVVFIPLCNWEFTPKHFGHLWVSSDTPPFNELEAHLVHPVKELSRSVFKDDYEKEYGLQAIDNINLLYVAFTRAEEQLYIHTTQPPANMKEDTQYNAATLLYYTLKQKADWTDNLTSRGGTGIELGTLPNEAEKGHGESENPQLEEWISVPWKDKLWLGVNKRKVSVSDPEPHETGYGNLFHETVSKITYIDEQWTPESHVEHNIPYASSEIKTRIIGDLRFVTGEGMQHQWYASASKCYSEKEILDADGKILRPDRVVITPGGEVHVIDYKTGTEDENHSLQVRKYGELLTAMGYSAPRLFVIYPALKKTVEVPA